MSAPVRVLLACDHIDHSGALHGAGRQIIELVTSFDRTRVQPIVCVFRRPSKLGEELQSEGLPLIFLRQRSWNPIAVLKLMRIIRSQSIDVLHLTDFGASTYGRIAGRIARIPAIVHVRSHHSHYQPRGYPRAVELAYRALAPGTAKALAISHSVEEFAIARMGFRPGQTEVLNNPLARYSYTEPAKADIAALRRQYGIGDDDAVVGTVTRFHAAKGNRFLVDAFADILRRLPDAWLVLVGEGPEEAMLRARAEQAGIASRVIFAGFQREVQLHYGMFNVLVMPSLEEGFGNVAVEAMAQGIPVIASRLGGLPEIVTDDESGFLVEAGNPRVIADAAITLLQDPNLHSRMSEAARRRSEDFSIDRYIDHLEMIYRRVIGRSHAATLTEMI